jgi:hypothetical protein
MTFTIILLLPDYASSNWPHDAYVIKELDADDESAAITDAMFRAASEHWDDIFPEDIFPLFVIHGGKDQIDSADAFVR